MDESADPCVESPSKLAWYEQAWVALPMVLMAVGGAVGGACGGAGWAINQKVFRSIENPVLRYVLTGLISVAAAAAYIALAATLLSIFRGNG